MTVFIYRLYDPREPNVTRYVGKTCQKNIKSRLSQHICHSKRKQYYSSRWIQSILKENVKPELEILENCSIENWEEREKYYIKKYNNIKLTNIEPGGNSTTIRQYCRIGTTKNAKSIVQMDLNYNVINIFKSCSEAARQTGFNKGTLGSACRKNGNISHGFRWKWENNKEECNPRDKRFTAVLQYDLDNNFIKEYPSVKEASKITGLHPASITNCIHNITTRAGEYFWKIKDPIYIKYR
jgi:hypothetical protein